MIYFFHILLSPFLDFIPVCFSIFFFFCSKSLLFNSLYCRSCSNLLFLFSKCCFLLASLQLTQHLKFLNSIVGCFFYNGYNFANPPYYINTMYFFFKCRFLTLSIYNYNCIYNSKAQYFLMYGLIHYLLFGKLDYSLYYHYAYSNEIHNHNNCNYWLYFA